MISYIGTQLGIFSRIKFMKDTKEMLKLVAAIAEEHYNITDGAGSVPVPSVMVIR